MADTYYRIITRRDTKANWESANPVLEDGEWGKETDTGIIKMGNGSTAWKDLQGVQMTPGDVTPGTTSVVTGDTVYRFVDDRIGDINDILTRI